MKTILSKCEDKLVLVLPDDCVAQLGWEAGDVTTMSIGNGSLTVIRTQTAHDHAMEIARKGMVEYPSALERLAKS
jgi:antitoxin component of MazEF toxin-antitoxin module